MGTLLKLERTQPTCVLEGFTFDFTVDSLTESVKTEINILSFDRSNGLKNVISARNLKLSISKQNKFSDSNDEKKCKVSEVCNLTSHERRIEFESQQKRFEF